MILFIRHHRASGFGGTSSSAGSVLQRSTIAASSSQIFAHGSQTARCSRTAAALTSSRSLSIKLLNNWLHSSQCILFGVSPSGGLLKQELRTFALVRCLDRLPYCPDKLPFLRDFSQK